MKYEHAISEEYRAQVRRALGDARSDWLQACTEAGVQSYQLGSHMRLLEIIFGAYVQRVDAYVDTEIALAALERADAEFRADADADAEAEAEAEANIRLARRAMRDAEQIESFPTPSIVRENLIKQVREMGQTLAPADNQ